MPSSTFQVADEWANYLSTKKIDCSADVFKLVLTNTAVTKAGTQVLTDITQITTQNGYAPATMTMTFAETGAGTGIWRLSMGADKTWTASGGSFGPFRYVVMYDDTPAATPTDPIVGWWDYGSAITPADTETFTVDVDANFSVYTTTVT